MNLAVSISYLLLFQVKDVLSEQLEKYLFAQDVVVLSDRKFFLEHFRKHGNEKWLASILLDVEAV